MRIEQVFELLQQPMTEPVWGQLSTTHVQLASQSFGVLTKDLARRLRNAFRRRHSGCMQMSVFFPIV